MGYSTNASPNQRLNLCRLVGAEHPVDTFQMQLPDNEFVQSMSRKGDRCGNEAMETFFGTSKEDIIDPVKYKK
jgi:transposase InsO family protein